MCSSPGPADSKQSSPSMQGSCTCATHTVKSTDRPPTFNVTLPLPSIGANSAVTVLSFTLVCYNCVLARTTSGLISVAVEPVSTRAVRGAPCMMTGTWQKFPERVQPTTIVDSVLSSASGGSGAPLPRLCCWAPPSFASTALDNVPGVRTVPSIWATGRFPGLWNAWSTV